MNSKKTFRLLFGLILSSVFVFLIFRNVQFETLKNTLSEARLKWIFAGLCFFLIGYMFRIERWRKMLACTNPELKYLDCAGPFLASFAVNNILPFRAGDVLRAFAFNAQLGVSSGTVIATLLFERLLDFFTILLLFGAALYAFGDIGHYINIGIGTIVLGGISILLVLRFPEKTEPFFLFIGKVAMRLSSKYGTILIQEINKGFETLKYLSRGTEILNLLTLSFFAWTSEGFVFWFAAYAIPSIDNPLGGWLAFPVGTLATLIPSTPGYIGTFDYFTILSMTGCQNNQIAATAYALLVHGLLWLPPTVLGGIFLVARSIRIAVQVKK